MIVAVALGIASAIAVLVAAFAEDRRRLMMALACAALWGVANVLWLSNRLDLLPVADLALGLLALALSVRNESVWLRRIVALCYMRLGVQVADYITESQYLVTFIIGLNALFCLLLWVVAEPGVENGFRLLRRLRDRHRSGARLATPTAAIGAGR